MELATTQSSLTNVPICRAARKQRCAGPGPGRLFPPRHEALHAPVGVIGDGIIRWTPPRFREKEFHYSPCVQATDMAAPRAGEPILENSTRRPRVRGNAYNVKHARAALSLHVEGLTTRNNDLTCASSVHSRRYSLSGLPRSFVARATVRPHMISRPALVHRTARSMASSEISPSKVRE